MMFLSMIAWPLSGALLNLYEEEVSGRTGPVGLGEACCLYSCAINETNALIRIQKPICGKRTMVT